MQISTGASGASPRKQPTPEFRVAPPDTFGNPALEQARMGGEYLELLDGPGKSLNLLGNNTGKRRIEKEKHADVPAEGIALKPDGTASVHNIPNPDRPDGRWDPYQFMPHFTFEKKEDAFPVSPDFDGDFKLANNAPDKPNQPGSRYKDGIIGGNQELSAGFAVSKKGEYTVLSYSFYYATNKAVGYHNNDYSIAQVYLKPGKDGKLEPSHLYSSWHHGGVMTPWKDLKKDDQGRPVIKVHQGSHATQPLGVHDAMPTKGFQLRGDGQAVLDGQALPYQLSYEAFQDNVANAQVLDATSDKGKLRLKAMSWGEVNFNPLLPEIFEAPLTEVARKGVKAIDKKVDQAKDFVEDTYEKAKDVIGDGVSRLKSKLHL